MNFTIVDFTDGGDGISALYYDGQLVMAGDYYHNKINESIDAFIRGFNFAVENGVDREARILNKSVHYKDYDDMIYNAPPTMNQLIKIVKEADGISFG